MLFAIKVNAIFMIIIDGMIIMDCYHFITFYLCYKWLDWYISKYC